MEFGSFSPSSPERAPSKDMKDSDSNSEKKKKLTKKGAGRLGGFIAERTIADETASPETPPKPKESESLWQRLTKGLSDGTGREGSLIRPSILERSDTDKNTDSDGKSADSDLERPKSSAETAAQQQTREYTEMRLDDAEGELRELPLGSVEAGEAAANVALLQAMKARLESREVPPEAALDEAESAVAAQLETESVAAESDAEDDLLSGTAAVDNERLEDGSMQTTMNEKDAANRQEEAIDDADARAAYMSASAGSAPVAAGSGSGIGNGGAIPPGGSGSYIGGSGGNTPNNYTAPYSAGIPQQRTPNLAPNPNTIAASTAANNERQAAGQGLAVGAVVGYLFGRRRGRIKAETKFAPVQQKLEKQVKSLQETIRAKEDRIRGLAREKMQAATPGAERQKIVEKLVAAPNKSEAAAGVTLASAAVAVRETAPVVSSSETVAQAQAEVGNSGSFESARPEKPRDGAVPLVDGLVIAPRAAERAAATERSMEAHAMDMGKVLVEAPVAAALALRSEKPKPADIVPFHKKVEQFNQEELKQTAAKIEVQGVSLREMREAGRIDEAGMKRVIAEFLEGGNVAAAVNREVLEREARFERDPRMRQAARSAGGVAAGAAAVVAGGRGFDDDNDSQFGESGRGNSNDSSAVRRPEPDAARLEAIRKQQMTAVGVSTAAMLAAIIGVILVLG